MKESKILSNLEQLNPGCFIYENYESSWWSLLDMDYMTAMDVANVMRAVEKYAIGYCDGAKLTLRPNSDSFAVMFEKDGERFWFHIQKWEFEAPLNAEEI